MKIMKSMKIIKNVNYENNSIEVENSIKIIV